MSDDVVHVRGTAGTLAILRGAFFRRPGDLAIYRPTLRGLPSGLEPVLRKAAHDPLTWPSIAALARAELGVSIGSGDAAVARVLDAFRAGWLLAVPIPEQAEDIPVLPADGEAAGLPEMRRAAPSHEAACQAVLSEAGRQEVGAHALLPQAARVLAAWSADPTVSAGRAVWVVRRLGRIPSRGRLPFAVAAHLAGAARCLASESLAGRADATAELRAAAALLSWRQVLEVLVRMTPAFRLRMAPVLQAEVGAPPPPRPRPQSRPTPEEEPDEGAQADALREAARHGVPFCIPCAIAAIRRMAA